MTARLIRNTAPKRCLVGPRSDMRIWWALEYLRRHKKRKPVDIRLMPIWCRPRSERTARP